MEEGNIGYFSNVADIPHLITLQLLFSTHHVGTVTHSCSLFDYSPPIACKYQSHSLWPDRWLHPLYTALSVSTLSFAQQRQFKRHGQLLVSNSIGHLFVYISIYTLVDNKRLKKHHGLLIFNVYLYPRTTDQLDFSLLKKWTVWLNVSPQKATNEKCKQMNKWGWKYKQINDRCYKYKLHL
jgi:hypothetical protein